MYNIDMSKVEILNTIKETLSTTENMTMEQFTFGSNLFNGIGYLAPINDKWTLLSFGEGGNRHFHLFNMNMLDVFNLDFGYTWTSRAVAHIWFDDHGAKSISFQYNWNCPNKVKNIMRRCGWSIGTQKWNDSLDYFWLESNEEFFKFLNKLTVYLK